MKLSRKLLFLGLAALAYLYPADGVAVMSVDLGSEWMKIAVVSPGKPMEIVLNKESRRKTPVAVSIRNGERLIGDPAMVTAVRFPEKTYHHFVDLLGKSIDHAEVKRFQARFPYHNITGFSERNSVVFHHKEGMDFTPEELVAMILKKAQEIAEGFTEQKIKDCVITVPPYFNQAERRAMIEAANFADLKVLQLINANTAAALNYGVFRRKDFNSSAQNIMLFDMGASDTVATIISYQVVKTKEAGYVEENPQLTIKGVGFERTLGGLEIQLRLRDHLAKAFNKQKKTKTDVFSSPRAMSKLFKEAGRVKNVLSANDHCMSQIEGLIEEINFQSKVTREEFNKLIADMLDLVVKPIEKALESAGMAKGDIEQVILVGGGTRVPKVQELLGEYLKKELGKNLNTDEAPAMGAAYQAAYLSTGFKVKKFGIRESNLYPIQVDFSRDVVKEDGSMDVRQVRRMLFSYQNQYPQKKVMTFNKHVDNFNFHVSYGSDSDQINEELKQYEGKNISKVKLRGVKEAFSKHEEEETESRGIKAHFRMDESGILQLDQVEAEFKKKVAVEEEPSTLSKLGSTISNLFGGGSSDAVDSKQNETTNKTEEAEKPSSASKNETEESKDAKNATSVDSKKDVKQVTVKEAIKTTQKFIDMPRLSQEDEKAIRKRIHKFDMDDKKRKEREAARNSLESFVFDTQDKLSQTEFEAATTETERQNIIEKLQAASNWLDEETEEQEAEVYKKKLSELKDLTKNVFTRVKEHADRPDGWKALFDTLNISRLFLESLKNTSTEESVFTAVEIETLDKLINETTKWEEESKAEQEATPLTKMPVVTVQMIVEKIANLEREVRYLLSKSRLAKPKAKDESKASNEDKTESTKEKTTTEKSDEEKSKSSDETTQGEKEETLEQPAAAETTDSPSEETTTEEPAAETTTESNENTPKTPSATESDDEHTEL